MNLNISVYNIQNGNKRIYLDDPAIPLSMIDYIPSYNIPGDPTAKRAMAKLYYSERIKLIEKTAIETDLYLYTYIIKGVTEERSYTYLKTKLNIPCRKDMYYDRYRCFFWLLDQSRE